MFDRLKTALADRYTIERELGSGGMATVHLAQDLKHERRVALKVLRTEIAAAVGPERFLREIKITANLNHPHILPLLDSGEADGFLFYVMPYVEGESLRDRLVREKQLPVDDSLKIASEVGDALGFAHAHNVIHRDIKPENILLEAKHAVVADFGVARAIAAAGETRLTETGIALGTPAYLSPEQASGERDLDGRSDVYAVGCVLYEMLAGEPPFTGPTAESIVHQHLTAEPTPVTTVRPTVPGDVVTALEKALAKAPADRFDTAAQLVDALNAALLSISAPTVTVRRKTPVAFVTAMGVVVVVAAFWVFGRTTGPAGAVRPLAERPWVMVAAFEGQLGGADLLAARAAVMATLDGSELVVTVPDNQIAGLLHAAGRTDTTRLNNDLARELAVRNSVARVVTGRVDPVGPRYSIALRVVGADDGTLVATGTETAESESELMNALRAAAAQLLAAFADDEVGARAAQELPNVMTPSFEAFKLWREGGETFDRMDHPEARRLYWRALQLDPDFARAWGSLGTGYWVTGPPDSVEFYYDEALRRRERLGERWASNYEALLALHQNDLETALRIYERLERQGRPFSTNHAVTLGYLGRREEAADLYRRALLRQIQPSAITLSNLYISQLAVGNLDEAWEVSQRLDNLGHDWAPLRALEWASVDEDWHRLERLADALWNDPAARPSHRRAGARTVAVTRLLRGRARSARERLAAEREEVELAGARSTDMPPGAGAGNADPLLASVWVSWYTEGQMPPLEEYSVRDTSAIGEYVRAVRAAAVGDTAAARWELAQLKARPEMESRRYGEVPVFLEALIAARGKRWQEVVDLIGPGAARGYDVGRLIIESPRIPRQWLVAEAYSRLERPDSAGVLFERVAELRGQLGEVRYRAMVYPFVHRRLAQVYTELGDTTRAEEHWRLFLDVFTDPDPELEYMVGEGREALAALASDR